jgi:hypothetical protein
LIPTRIFVFVHFGIRFVSFKSTAFVLRDQPFDLGVHARRSLSPDFVGDRRAGHFERFVPTKAGCTGKLRFVPFRPDRPVLSGGEQQEF